MEELLKDTKIEILDAATELFAENGFDGSSMREISKKAGTSLNSIRYHYGSKEDLLEAMLNQLCDSLYESPMRILESGAESKDEFRTKLGLFLNEVLAQMISMRKVIQVAFREGHRVPAGSDYKPQHGPIIKFIKGGQKKGFITKEIKAEMICGAFMDRLMPQVLHANQLKKIYKTDIRDPSYRKKWVDATLTLFLHGLYSRV